jgi:spermidine/putrescine transport system ATP-binding protein
VTTIDVELRNVIKEFPSGRGQLPVRAVDDISLQINDGEFFALLGPSGCGKTTTLRMIAGFEDTSSGDILIRGKAVQHIPPFHRPVNTVFQDYALFPHMTVLQNVMFGLRMENVPKAQAREMAYDALNLVQLPTVGDRKPRQLSGGQQQRVALARALVKKPAVLLLDEPLGALDLKLRKAMQFELKAMQQALGITFIYVTHDQEEAMTMADRIGVMHDGVLLQVGTPQEIYETPATRYVADFIGETNFILGTFEAAENEYGKVKINDESIIDAMLGERGISPDTKVTVAIRPEKVALFPCEGSFRSSEGNTITVEAFKQSIDSQANLTVLKGQICEAYYIGTDTRYQIMIGDTIELVCRSQNFGHRFDTIYKVGDAVYVYWENDNARVLTH